jgi:hypothetical protein
MTLWILCGIAAAVIFYAWLDKPADEIDYLMTFTVFMFGCLSLLFLFGVWLYSRI